MCDLEQQNMLFTRDNKTIIKKATDVLQPADTEIPRIDDTDDVKKSGALGIQHLTGTAVVVSLLAFALIGYVSLAVADVAFADDTISFSTMTGILQTIVSVLLLPLGILIAASRIVYLAIFPGIMNIDPLEMMEGPDFSAADVKGRIKGSFWGFAKGLAWVCGIWVIIQLCLTVVNMLASALDANF